MSKKAPASCQMSVLGQVVDWWWWWLWRWRQPCGKERVGGRHAGMLTGARRQGDLGMSKR
ncbi:hypothetical protein E2C01_101681 [Portunus trituberculatus]|uniref:Uncharacterized protein n=1 Tax=Portunus trituberculatus TaxID=210409 RepID=A0A5B7KKZ6_PORTR|nr:hypothetical protein [Portunus trituberculatus]